MSELYDPIEYWNNRSKGYAIDEGRRVQTERETEFLLGLYKSVANGESLSVLDIGSGYGRLLESFKEAKIPVEMFMCDIAKGFAKVASDKTGTEVTVWDGNALPYKDMAFDVVVSFDVLLHAPKKSVDKLWIEHTRVCKDFLFVATSGDFMTDYEHPYCISHDYDRLVELVEDFEVLIWKRWKRRQRVRSKAKRLNIILRRRHAS